MPKAALALLLAAAPLAASAEGEALFAAQCAMCHGADGSGVAGLAPPLSDAALWERLGEEAPAYLAGVLVAGLSGTIEAGGQTYAGLVMPPAPAASDAELAAVGTWVLRALAGTEATLSPALVAGTRADPPSHEALRARRAGG